MSPKLPRITSAQLRRALRRDGWEVVRQSGSHAIFKHPKKPGRVTLPIHATVTIKMKTLETILEQAELTLMNCKICSEGGRQDHERVPLHHHSAP